MGPHRVPSTFSGMPYQKTQTQNKLQQNQFGLLANKKPWICNSTFPFDLHALKIAATNDTCWRTIFWKGIFMTVFKEIWGNIWTMYKALNSWTIYFKWRLVLKLLKRTLIFFTVCNWFRVDWGCDSFRKRRAQVMRFSMDYSSFYKSSRL